MRTDKMTSGRRRGGGGGTPLYKPYGYMPPKGYGLALFWSETGIDFALFGLESVWFTRELR